MCSFKKTFSVEHSSNQINLNRFGLFLLHSTPFFRLVINVSFRVIHFFCFLLFVTEYNFAKGIATGRMKFYSNIRGRELQKRFQTLNPTTSQQSMLHSQISNTVPPIPQRSILGLKSVRGVLQQKHVLKKYQPQTEAQAQTQPSNDSAPKALVREIMGLIDTLRNSTNNNNNNTTLTEPGKRFKRT